MKTNQDAQREYNNRYKTENLQGFRVTLGLDRVLLPVGAITGTIVVYDGNKWMSTRDLLKAIYK